MDHRAEVARTLRVTHGYGYKRIARILGADLTRDRIRSWLRVVDGRARRGRTSWRRRCDNCGLPCSGATCASCRAVAKFNRRQEIEWLWKAGMPSAEIDEALGTGTTVQGGEPTKMRRDGWDVPYRLPRVA